VRAQAAAAGGAPSAGLWRTAAGIYHNEGGLRALYRGVWPTTLRAAMLTATQLPVYDHAKYGGRRGGWAGFALARRRCVRARPRSSPQLWSLRGLRSWNVQGGALQGSWIGELSAARSLFIPDALRPERCHAKRPALAGGERFLSRQLPGLPSSPLMPAPARLPADRPPGSLPELTTHPATAEYFGEGHSLHFACSIIAGVACATVVAPVDLIKSRFMWAGGWGVGGGGGGGNPTRWL
jgi:hypothetical protein